MKIRYSWTKHKFNLYCCENKIFEIGKGKTSGLLNLGRFILGRFYLRNSFSVAGGIYCKLRNCKVPKGNNKGKCNGPVILTTNEFVSSLPDDLGSSYADGVLH